MHLTEQRSAKANPQVGLLKRLRTSFQLLRASRRFLYVSVLVSIIAYLLLCVNVPLSLKPAAGHDDGLFMYHGLSIDSYQWLGAYSRLTLMKGPGYPIFLALAGLFRIPVALAHAVLYAFSICCIAFLTHKLFRSVLFSLLTFEVLLWNFGPDAMRAMRDAIYTPLILISFAFAVLSLFLLAGRRAIAVAVCSGAAFGWFWMTREESVIAVPILLIPFIGSMHKSFRAKGSFRFPAKVFASFLVGCFAVLGPVALMNWFRYGVFTIVDIKGEFEQCLETLQSVKPDVRVPYAPVPKSAREKIYAISPTFAQLRVLLDGPNTPLEGWKQPGCGFYPDTCGDYAGGWFMWALRDAVSLNGDYSSAPTASRFYRNVTAEIKKACDSGKVSCSHTLLPYISTLDAAQKSKIRASFIASIRRLAFIDLPAAAPDASLGPDDQIALAAWFLNTPNHTPPPALPPSIEKYRLTRSALAYRVRILLLYSKFMPMLLSTGLVCTIFLFGQFLYRRTYSIGLLIVCAAWIGVALRVFILILIDTSWFPGITNEYLGYAFPLAAYASLVSLMLVAREVNLQFGRTRYHE